MECFRYGGQVSDGFLWRETLIEITEELCLQVEIALYLRYEGRTRVGL